MRLRPVILATAALTLAGCGGERTVSPKPQTVIGSVPTQTAPATTSTTPSGGGGTTTTGGGGAAASGKALFASNGCVSCHPYKPAGSKAIAGPRAAGIHVVLVTGRMFRSIRPYALETGLDDPVACYHGAVVAEPKSGRWLRHVPIPLELAREAIAAVRDEGFGLNCYVDDD